MAEVDQQHADVLEGGTYEIIRKRLEDQGRVLTERLDRLNAARRAVFGAIEPKLLATERITTDNNCIPRDIISLGERFLFAYNVQFGLKSTTDLKDVFALYRLEEQAFVAEDLAILDDDQFYADFANLYKYYKQTVFTRFWLEGPHLYMVFQIGKSVSDIKAFKWLITPDNKLQYIDNRSDHEVHYPPQHAFEWKRTTRDNYRDGKHPHISIQDRLFIECIGGDLTLKIEDNTRSGEGIYTEPVEDSDQKLDDAEIHYALIGPIILLKIRPYREQKDRYLIFNEKIHQVIRCDEIGNSCTLLPEGQGLIFANGYYLIGGEFKRFDFPADDMLFERRISSPNGEDTLFTFFRRDEGLFVLLSYNIIEQTVQPPVLCHGFSLFHEGEMVYFRAEQQPQKHHAVQLWQTPYVSADYVPPVVADSFLQKIGNRDLVRAMAESRAIGMLIRREDVYRTLYEDIHRSAVALLDAYFWIRNPEAEGLGEVLDQIRDSAGAAIDEFEKVRTIRQTTANRIAAVQRRTRELLDSIKPDLMTRTEEFIGALAKLRTLRGEIIGLRELRYTDLKAIETLEQSVVERSDALSGSCVEFLLRPDALNPWEERVDKATADAETLARAADAKELEERIATIGAELETMIEVVGNLKIDDATKSTRIIDGCSAIFTKLNTARARLRNRKRDLQKGEAVAEFSAQIKLLEQSVISYLDVADTTEKCDEYLNRLLVQIEELEGRFADFDEYVIVLADKRTEVTAALESRRLQIREERTRKASSIQTAAERMINAIRSRAEGLKSEAEIHACFAGDMMVDKVRAQIAQLVALDESVRADELESRLKTIRENAIRQLKDRQELFVEGENTIRFGRHLFSVNVQKPELTILRRDGRMFFHITGTNFLEAVDSPELAETRDVWDMDIVSENAEVYRAEWLAWSLLEAAGSGDVPSEEQLHLGTEEEVLEVTRRFMAGRFEEGYTKGVHDIDAARIVRALSEIRLNSGLLRFDGTARALARVWWSSIEGTPVRDYLSTVLSGVGRVLSAFPDAGEFADVRGELAAAIGSFADSSRLFDRQLAEEASNYLFSQLTVSESLVISPEAAHLHDELLRVANQRGLMDDYDASLARLNGDLSSRVRMVRGWIRGFLRHPPEGIDSSAAEEAVALLATKQFDRNAIQSGSIHAVIAGLNGSHARIQDGTLSIDYPRFAGRLRRFARVTIPAFRRFTDLKRKVADVFRDDINLDGFQPKVLTSFVRSRLIDEVYLPLIGDNLAKQIGASGAQRRTDLMGMLLVISPPGYGKTTLMEYVANRLGLVFAKINGPSLGHQVTSLDPEDAPNAAAREEVEKLNLALEMGDNIMLYIDDIQHCNPEFLQKFISLCDGQRRIEGVWKGRSRTYDMRGRKVCVVMAGNPYTESGEKFRIPDMLANRADTYNLGDIIGGHRTAFELSYIENCLTSNAILQPLHSGSRKDIQSLMRLARDESSEGIELEGNLSAEEVNDAVAVLRKLFVVQGILLKVNRQYIVSAAQADAYRTEPPFRLQGSYRNMNRLAEKIVPLMNDEELKTVILSHYENESQTLTTGAEANMLKFLEIAEWMNEEQRARWAAIKETFQRNTRLHGMDSGDHMATAIAQLGDLAIGVTAIRDGLKPLGEAGNSLANAVSRYAEAGPASNAPQSIQVHIPEMPTPQFHMPAQPEIRMPEIRMPEIRMPESMKAEISDASIDRLKTALSELKLRVVAPNVTEAMEATDAAERPRGEFLAVGAMRECLETNGFDVEEPGRGEFRIHRDGGLPIHLRVRHDRLTLRVDLGPVSLVSADFLRTLLELNAEILPVSFGLEGAPDGSTHLLLLETRDGRDLTRNELIEVIRAIETASRKGAELLG